MWKLAIYGWSYISKLLIARELFCRSNRRDYFIMNAHACSHADCHAPCQKKNGRSRVISRTHIARNES